MGEFVKVRGVLFCVVEFAGMRYYPVSFKRKPEAFGGFLVPTLEHFFAWKPIECVVNFQCVKVLCVVLEPFCFAQIFRVKNASPMVIVEA